MTNDFLTIRNVYFRGIVSIEFKTEGRGTPSLISGFLLPRRGGGFSRGGEGFQTGGVCVFDDGLTRLIRLELLVIGDLNPCKIGGET